MRLPASKPWVRSSTSFRRSHPVSSSPWPTGLAPCSQDSNKAVRFVLRWDRRLAPIAPVRAEGLRFDPVPSQAAPAAGSPVPAAAAPAINDAKRAAARERLLPSGAALGCSTTREKRPARDAPASEKSDATTAPAARAKSLARSVAVRVKANPTVRAAPVMRPDWRPARPAPGADDATTCIRSNESSPSKPPWLRLKTLRRRIIARATKTIGGAPKGAADHRKASICPTASVNHARGCVSSYASFILPVLTCV